jgi:hypothetical protein
MTTYPERLDWAWRFILTDLTGRTLAYLDGVASDRKVTRSLNKPASSEGRVPSDDNRINLVHTDGDAYMAMNSRLLYGFRHEPQTSIYDPKWVCRFGGILMQPDDEAGSEDATTHYTAFDPWQRLMSMPVTRDNGTIPVNGMYRKNQRGGRIARDLLVNADAAWGTPFGLHIDYGQFAPGVTTYSVEDTDLINMHFDQGCSVGDAWTQLTEQGFDICLDPVYDPYFRPGIVAALRIEQVAGTTRYKSVFSWDKPGRTASGVSRIMDGTKQANKVIYYSANGIMSPAISDAPNIAKYGQYIEQKAIGSTPLPEVVELLAQGELEARKAGGLTLALDQIPEPSPIPLVDYDIGDVVPVYASDRLRFEIAHEQRVYEIPIEIGDDGREKVSKIVVSDPSL